MSNRTVLRESKEGQDRREIESGNALLFNLGRSPSQPRAGGSAAGWAVPGWGRAPIHHCPAQGNFPALPGIHPTAAKVLVRQPSSFPGIKEPTQSGGIPRSEAKALLECRRLVPPAGGRLLQGLEELCPGAVPYSPRGVGTGKGLPAAPQPGAALNGPPEMPHPGHAPAPAQKAPKNPAGPRQCRHGGAAEQRGQPFPGPTSRSSPAPPACVPPAPNPCPSSRRPAASSSLKARAMCPQRH
ncbi:basic proline-rich protein-like [Manacus candei]|uniref:basic proline-rich protein-like n=1 Tax=Manacus candei TaxID=415023 RepID=UPI002227D978|nr:basic proline-rich protein-like [Manacus candei]XP_051630641.1 basic proline-rich protein-like [Manacus candei]